MRIAMVGDEFYPAVGGAPSYTMGLGKALTKLGAEPIVLTHAHRGYPEEEEFDGLKVKRLKGFVMPRLNRAVSAGLARRLHECIKFGGFNVVHGQDIYSPMALLSIHSAHKRKIPSALTCHSIHKAGGIWRLIYQPILSAVKCTNRVIAVSGAAKGFCVALGVPDSKAEIIPNGVDLSIFNTDVDGSTMRAKLGIGQEPLVVTTIRLVKRKGPMHLVNTFSKVLKAIPNAKLAMAGVGPEAANLRAQIRKLNMERSVVMLGGLQRKQVAELMAAANVFVLPSMVESFGMVLLEAMAIGTPIVCTRTQGALEIIKDDKDSLAAPVADSDALADAIVRVLSDRRLAARLRKNGLKTVHERFSWEKTAKMTLTLYEKVREKHAKRRSHN
jgi:glycosyltransferase involved in cell wall biosynthesis